MNMLTMTSRGAVSQFLPKQSIDHDEIQDVDAMPETAVPNFRDKVRFLFLLVAVLTLAGCEPETLGGPGVIYDSKGNPPPVVVPEFTPDHPDFAETINGTKITGRFAAKVVEVTPSLSLTLLTKGNQQIKIRFESLVSLNESPSVQKRAKTKLTKMLIGRTVEVAMTRKQAGVSLGWVFAAGQNINELLVTDGMARVDPSNGDPDLKKLESSAKTKQLGLWAQASD